MAVAAVTLGLAEASVAVSVAAVVVSVVAVVAAVFATMLVIAGRGDGSARGASTPRRFIAPGARPERWMPAMWFTVCP